MSAEYVAPPVPKRLKRGECYMRLGRSCPGRKCGHIKKTCPYSLVKSWPSGFEAARLTTLYEKAEDLQAAKAQTSGEPSE